MNPYRKRILGLIKPVIEQRGKFSSALDFGSGDGWFACELARLGVIGKITPVDVVKRKKNFIEPFIYDGKSLPFNDRYFDLSYAIDVMHHCPSPKESLRDLLRCTEKYFLIKDHIYRNKFQKIILCVLDEIGNRRFGIRSIYKYQRGWEWSSLIEEAGFKLEILIYPARCHVGLLGLLTNRFEFIALWKRVK